MQEESKQLSGRQKPSFWRSPWLVGICLFTLLIAVDQLTKLWADHYFIDVLGEPNGRIILIEDVLELCIEYNRGIAFSSFAGSSMGVKIAIVLSTVVIMGVLVYVYIRIDKRRTLLWLALVFIIAGGVGNLIDRIYYQVWDPSTAGAIRDGVRDMVYVNIIFNFGVCNFADFFIVAGAIMLILALFFFDTDAVFPLTKKYKALAAEAQAKEEAKQAASAQTTEQPKTDEERAKDDNANG